MSKSIVTKVHLPNEMIDQLKRVSRLAGLSVETIIKLILAMEVIRWQDSQAAPKPDKATDTAIQESQS